MRNPPHPTASAASPPRLPPRYAPQLGRGLSSIDNGTLQYLSQAFGAVPVLLVPGECGWRRASAAAHRPAKLALTPFPLPPPLPCPVDYTLPAPAPMAASSSMALSAIPLPEARACQAPTAADAAVTLAELESLLCGGGGVAQEGELAEMSQWFRGLSEDAKTQALASVARSLSFADNNTAGGAATPSPQHLPAPTPALTVYADALAAPSAVPAATAAAAPARAVLGDCTNQQGAPATKALSRLSSKLHVAASKKATLQVRATLHTRCMEAQQLDVALWPLCAALASRPHLAPPLSAAATRGCQGAAGLPAERRRPRGAQPRPLVP